MKLPTNVDRDERGADSGAAPCSATGTVFWDLKHGEWATHFESQRGEYGRHLIIGHRTGIRRYGSVRSIGQPPFVGRKPKPKKL